MFSSSSVCVRVRCKTTTKNTQAWCDWPVRKTVVNESGARKAFTEVLDELMHKGYSQIEVVSGLTALGVPKLAYEEAQAKGLRTVGIACSEAKKFPCFPCNDIIIVGKRWGDESETFLQCIDMLVLIGEGGAQSWQEFNVFKGPKRRGILQCE